MKVLNHFCPKDIHDATCNLVSCTTGKPVIDFVTYQWWDLVVTESLARLQNCLSIAGELCIPSRTQKPQICKISPKIFKTLLAE